MYSEDLAAADSLQSGSIGTVHAVLVSTKQNVKTQLNVIGNVIVSVSLLTLFGTISLKLMRLVF